MRTLTESETCTLANALQTAAADYARRAIDTAVEPRLAAQFERQRREAVDLTNLLDGLPTVKIEF
jgi:hypothetical protein